VPADGIAVANVVLVEHYARIRAPAASQQPSRSGGVCFLAVAGEEPYARRVPPRHDAEAVALDRVSQSGPVSGCLAGEGRQGSMKPAAPRLRCNMVLSEL
jgi:hypothetical protein